MKFSRSTAQVLALLCAATHAQPIKSCDEFAIRLPNVNRTLCEFAQLRPSGVKSVRGRPLLVRDVKPDDARLRVLVVGGIHGDELSSASMAFHWIKLATVPPSDTPNPVHWRFIPALNPDGLMATPPPAGQCQWRGP